MRRRRVGGGERCVALACASPVASTDARTPHRPSQARDPQIPGLLVHNEWRGTFEEFEESIEFGELDLFLKIDPGQVQQAAQADPLPDLPSSSALSSNATLTPAAPRAMSHSVATLPRLAQPRAPSQTTLAPALPFAPSGSGSRKEQDAESFLSSLGISDLNLTEEELNEILDAGKGDKEGEKEGATAAKTISSEDKAPRSLGKYPNNLGLGTSKPSAPRQYVPSADAGVKPLRLARMGEGSERAASSTSPLQVSPSARYNASQLSSKALAAEAEASISSRSFSSMRLREAVSKGDNLHEAFSSTRSASNTDKGENVVGREDLDDLMASLGLNDVKMSDEEAEAFLLDGTIPSGLDSHGQRLGRAGSIADRARNEAAARDVARRAKEKGYGSGSSRPSSVASDAEPAEKAKSTESNEQNVQEQVKSTEAPAAEGVEANAQAESNAEKRDSENGQDSQASAQPESPIESTPRQKTTALPSTSNDTVQGEHMLKADEFMAAEANVKTPEGKPQAIKEKLFPSAPIGTSDTEASTRQAEADTEAEDADGVSVELARETNTVADQSALEPRGEESVEELKTDEDTPAPIMSPASAMVHSPPSSKEKPAPLQLDGPPSMGDAESPSVTAPTPPSKEKSSRNVSMSPQTSRRALQSPSLTPSRRGMDFPRKESSSSLSDAVSPMSSSNSISRISPTQPPHSSSPSTVDSVRSSKNKKFFSIGRRKGRKSGSKPGDGSDSEEEATSTTISPSSSTDRQQKTLSMILREADEAMNGLDGDDDDDADPGFDEGRDSTEDAFGLELDDDTENMTAAV